MPFDLSIKKKAEGLRVSRYWLDNVVKKKVFLWRELGVSKQYRREIAPFLCFPLFSESSINGYEVMLLSTNLSSQVFKICLGANSVPIHFFLINDLLLFGR